MPRAPKRNYEAEMHRRLAESHLTAAAASTDLWYLKWSVKQADLEPELLEDYKRQVRTTTDLMKRATVSAAKLEIQLVSFLQNREAPEFDDERPDLDGVIRYIKRQRQSIVESLDLGDEVEEGDVS